ncbi:MAG: prepilin peptidase [Lachnospiraceae bacterium]|nr:prepilin peptidase [Lachnospiraceae bacterium]MDD3615033.1 prepilin peptidase [Lachnospiraceae bacterium]
MLYENIGLTIYIFVISGILGAVMGSFINCMAWRIAHKESVLHGRSHCAVCNHPLNALDLIPVFSYLFLKGRCRYCKEKISPRYMLTELFMALSFVLIVARYDVTFEAMRYLAAACLLLGLSLVDLEIYEIPDGFIIAGIIWWIATLPFMNMGIAEQIKSGLLGGICIGGGLLLLSLVFDKIMKKESLGGGDVKLFFMVGLYLGLGVSLLNLIVACILGIVFAFGLKRQKIPFGPAISCATLISLLVGSEIVNWYIGLF